MLQSNAYVTYLSDNCAFPQPEVTKNYIAERFRGLAKLLQKGPLKRRFSYGNLVSKA